MNASDMTIPSTQKVFEKGTTYLLFIPPSWIIGGTCVDVTDSHVIMDNVTYLESSNTGHSFLQSLPFATSAKDLKAAVARCWTMPNRTSFLTMGILIAMPCQRDLIPLVRQMDADEIKKVR